MITWPILVALILASTAVYFQIKREDAEEVKLEEMKREEAEQKQKDKKRIELLKKNK